MRLRGAYWVYLLARIPGAGRESFASGGNGGANLCVFMHITNSGFRVRVRQFFRHTRAAFGWPGLFAEGVCEPSGLGRLAQLFFTPTQRGGGFSVNRRIQAFETLLKTYSRW